MAAEPSEARLRRVVLGLAMLIGPPLLLFFYYQTMFPGLTNGDALDFAQLGRNMSQGRGFVTYILRPLALVHGDNPLAQPDVTHGPLYPFILAIAFGALGARDSVAALVSGVFYLLTIPVIYVLGTRLFHRGVGLVTALIFTFNALMLEYAISGLHLTLFIFLATSLMLVIYHLGAWAHDHAGEPKARLPRAQLVLAGLLSGALYLTDPIFFWILPVISVAVIWLVGPRRIAAAPLFLVPLVVLVLPCMWRNQVLAGNPIFGLRGMELWMNTGQYPGYLAYRLDHSELVPGAGLFKAVINKVLLGAGQVIQAFPQITASWVLAFFLPALLFRFTDPAANAARRVLMFCFLGIFVGMLLFGVNMPSFTALIPTMLIFAVAFLLILIQQARLGQGSRVSVAILMMIAVCYPLASAMWLSPKPQPLAVKPSALALGKSTGPKDVSLSDQPWTIAWYADRPSIWLPARLDRVQEVRNRFATTNWLVLTEDASRYQAIQANQAPWSELYAQLVRLNIDFVRAPEATQKKVAILPLSGLPKPLEGFAWLPPAKGTALSTVVAVVPEAEKAAGAQHSSNDRLARNSRSAN